jgi:hypothetical protein
MNELLMSKFSHNKTHIHSEQKNSTTHTNVFNNLSKTNQVFDLTDINQNQGTSTKK